jgi:uncharacterized repeat protein (TIGR03803 family)
VFKITLAGKLTTLHSFRGADGTGPNGTLIQGRDGNFYGTTEAGGDKIYGTVFKITPTGALTTLHSFNFIEGYTPYAGLVQASDGNFYGTVVQGAAYNAGMLFRITPEGTLTILYNFCAQANCSDGAYPFGTLIQGTDGSLYGTAYRGGISNPTCATQGAQGCGTVFSISLGGVFTVLHSFDVTDGYFPAGLVQATSGSVYGMTQYGGTNVYGTIFSLSTGLHNFAAFVCNPAKVGQTFGILGQGFTGTTSVTLHGMPISFKVLSDTFMEATIPNGATTGYVTGTSPRGKLTSNVPFRVLPQVLSFTPPSGPVGTVVTITGVSLTQANGVGFGDDIGAHFTVNSDTQVTATVPNGAKTGPVGVRTLGGIGISSAIFSVTP